MGQSQRQKDPIQAGVEAVPQAMLEGDVTAEEGTGAKLSKQDQNGQVLKAQSMRLEQKKSRKIKQGPE